MKTAPNRIGKNRAALPATVQAVPKPKPVQLGQPAFPAVMIDGMRGQPHLDFGLDAQPRYRIFSVRLIVRTQQSAQI